MQLVSENLVIVGAGSSGSGKSTVAISYLNNARLTCRFIFDPSGEYALRLQRRPCTNAAELRAAIATGWVIFDSRPMFPNSDIAGSQASADAFAKFVQFAWIVAPQIPGQKIFFGDEIWRYCTPNFIPIELRGIIQDGRKRGLGLFATSQTPNKMNEAIVSQATEFIGFRLEGFNLIGWLKKQMETFPVDELPNLFLEETVRSECIAMNLRSKCIRRYELNHVTGKLRRI